MLSDNIRKYRKLNHMSQDELAEKLQVTRQSISLWETGQTQPSLDNIMALAELFGVSTDNLLSGDEPEAVCADTSDLPNGNSSKKKIIILIIICFVFVMALVASLLLWKNGIFSFKNGDTTSSPTTQSTSSPDTESSSIPDTQSTDSSSVENVSGNDNSSSNLTQSGDENDSSTKTPSKENVTSNSTSQTSQNASSSKDSESSSKNNTTSNNTSQSTSSKDNTDTSSKVTSTGSSSTLEDIDNGVLENTTSKKMDVPENMKLLGTNNAKEENNSQNVKATVVLYQLDGKVVNWITENDLLYVITSGNNRLVVIDSKTMTAISNVPLAGKPAEINIIGSQIYVSLPDLSRIDVFSKSSLNKTSSIYLDHKVSSFCIDGEYIYYSEHDQHCAVYRKNMTTNELTKILPDRGYTFYQPKLYLNKEDNILYIGETGSSGSTLFYYDATTLELKSYFRDDDYGVMNHTRDIFHVGDEIFWANYRLSDTNAKQIVGRYGELTYGSVNFASEELVSTFEGIFLTDTYECVVNYFDADFDFEYILITESYNIFFRDRDSNDNIIVGVNFSLQ